MKRAGRAEGGLIGADSCAHAGVGRAVGAARQTSPLCFPCPSPARQGPGRDQQHPSAVPRVGTFLPWGVLNPVVRVSSTIMESG